MKRLASIFLGIMLIALLAAPSWAAWTITPSIVTKAGHYLKWKVVLTSDNSALSATDILSSTYMSARMLRDIQGETLMTLKVSPGTGGVIPDTTINITLSDDESDALWTKTGISKDAISWHDLSADIKMYIPVTGKLYLTINDIGGSGDQVTLYFLTWVEEE